jgi:UDP-glucose 4-epimerase
MVDRRVVVTGVAGFWGKRVAEALVEMPGFHVIGVDQDDSGINLKGLDFIRADIRNPLLAELFQSEGIDTVCHLKFLDSDMPNEDSFEQNVMGTMKLLGSCAEAVVGRVILRSSTAVYGARPENSAFIPETSLLNGSRNTGWIRDMLEIETFCSGFIQENPEVALTVLRFSNVIGPKVDSSMTHFLKEPASPVLLGFNPMFQVIHEEDAVGALVHAVVRGTAGTFNVAAENPLPLVKLTTLAGKIPVPVLHWLVYWGQNMNGMRSRYSPIEPNYLRYPWVGDLSKMHTELAFEPRYTAEEALREFASIQRMHRYLPDSVALAYDEDRLRDTIERRRRIKEQEIPGTADPVEGESYE